MIEAVRITTGNAEHIQRTDRYLNEQNAATLDIGEKHLDYAVGKSDQRKDVEQIEADIVRYGKAADQYAGAFSGKVNASATGENSGQIMGEGILAG